MATYLHPGVYVEEIPSGVRPIEGVGTSTAVFLGVTARGPVGTPVRLASWGDFEERFGGVRDTGTAAQGDPMGHALNAYFSNGGTAAFVVRLGDDDNPGTASSGVLEHPDTADDLIRFQAADPGAWGDDLRVRLEAESGSPGTFSVRVGFHRAGADGTLRFFEEEVFAGVTLTPGEPSFVVTRLERGSGLVRAALVDADDYLLGVSVSADALTGLDPTDLNGRTMTVTVDRVGGDDARPVTFAGDELEAGATLGDVAAAIQEKVRGSLTADDRAGARDFTAAVQDDRLVLTSGTRTAGSKVAVTGPGDATDATELLLLGAPREGEERTGKESLDRVVADADDPVDLGGGADPGGPGLDDYQDAFARLEKVREIRTVCVPGQPWGGTAAKAIVDAAVAHAEKMLDRVVVVDPPAGSELTQATDVTGLGLPTSTYTALYYPWVKVANPSFDPETNPAVPETVLVAPSGFAAGLWGRIDGRRGVWKAPAGVEATLRGAAALEFQVENGDQDVLNPLGVNCLRSLPGFGPVVWGARTLATKADPEWRYVPVRRTAIFLEQSIYGGIQWAVFEPNNHVLWASLRGNIEAFLDTQFRAGAFQGEKASDAYFVRCGLGQTMTQAHIDAGQVIVLVGFAPLKPAEFVIIRIQQKVGQQ